MISTLAVRLLKLPKAHGVKVVTFFALFLTFIVNNKQAVSQTTGPSWEGLPEILLESLIDESTSQADYESMLNDLEYLSHHPVNLNDASESDLQKLIFLTDFQIKSLLDYRNSHGPLLSVYELAYIHGYTEEIISLMLPYIMVEEVQPVLSFDWSSLTHNTRHEWLLRTQHVFENIRGYNVYDSSAGSYRYPGQPWLYYMRYSFQTGKRIYAGLTLENDPGEQFFKGSNWAGFDFNSAYIRVNDWGPLKSVVAGDFRLGFGQGLTLLNGSAPGKSALPLNVVRRNDGIKSFTSSDENNYFRGMAGTAKWGLFTITGFFSVKKRDANITDTIDHIIYFSSFQESGYHRTSLEVEDERSVRETTWGGNLTFRNNWLKTGLTFVQYRLDKFMEQGLEMADIYDFYGNNLHNIGMDYLITLNKVQLFGETAFGNHSWATLNGALLNINQYVDFSVVYRNFKPGYAALHANAFAESSSVRNEESLYIGSELHPVKNVSISLYADFYRFPWMRSNLSKPASGNDFLLQTNYTPGKNVSMYLKIKHEVKPEDVKDESTLLNKIINKKQTNARFHITYRVNSRMVFQSRIEYVLVKEGNIRSDNGIMAYHNIGYESTALPLTFDLRVAYFNTTDYASRIYAYERDLLAGFSFSPLYDEGLRIYMVAGYELSRTFKVMIRLSRSQYFNKSTIGSGYNEIDGHSKTELKAQLRIRL